MPPRSSEAPRIDMDALLKAVEARMQAAGLSDAPSGSNGVTSEEGQVENPTELSPGFAIIAEEILLVPVEETAAILSRAEPEPQSETVIIPRPQSKPAPVRKKNPVPRVSRGGTGHAKVESRGTDDLVRLYLVAIGEKKLLTKEQEVELAQQYEKGRMAAAELKNPTTSLTPRQERDLRESIKAGESAKKLFIQSNLRLVVSIAKRYPHENHLALLDLIQEGNIGLMHAVDKFEWRKGFKFSTYATWWVRQAISRGINDKERTIRLPNHASEDVNKLRRAMAEIEKERLVVGEASAHASINELTAATGWSREYLGVLLQAIATTKLPSLDEPLGDEADAATVQDVTADPRSAAAYEAATRDMDLADGLDKLMNCLDYREQQILKLRFGIGSGEPLTLEEVGVHFSLTGERIRQIQDRALTKLRHPSNSRLSGALRPYLDA